MTASVPAILSAGPVYHSGFVVSSIDEAIKTWVTIGGVGPFVVFENFTFVQPCYRGAGSGPVVTLAFGFSGDACIELIEQKDDTPSIYREGPAGFHHIGLSVGHVDSALKPYVNAGIDCTFRGRFSFGGECAYLDTRKQLGCFTELVERNAIIDSMLTQMKELHRNWDRRSCLAELR